MRFFVIIFASLSVGAQEPLPDLKPAEKVEAIRLFNEIRTNTRGPYGVIHWYCRDGRVLPVDTPCGGKGGFQHAAASPSATRVNTLTTRSLSSVGPRPAQHYDAAPP